MQVLSFHELLLFVNEVEFLELDVGGTDFLIDDAVDIFGVVEILGGGILVVERMRDKSLEGL